MNGGSKAVVVVHKHAGVFISKSKEDALCTKNMVPGESVYGEKRVSVQVHDCLFLSCFIFSFYYCIGIACVFCSGNELTCCRYAMLLFE